MYKMITSHRLSRSVTVVVDRNTGPRRAEVRVSIGEGSAPTVDIKLNDGPVHEHADIERFAARQLHRRICRRGRGGGGRARRLASETGAGLRPGVEAYRHCMPTTTW